MLAEIFYAFVSTSLAVTLIAGIVLALTPVLEKRFQPKVLCMIWVILAVRLMIPSFPGKQAQVSIPLPAYSIPLEQEWEEPLFETIWNEDTVAVHTETEVQKAEVSITEILTFIWVGGTGVFLVGHAAAYLWMKRKILRWSGEVADEQTVQVFNQCKKECGISREILLYRCKILPTPMLMGFLRPAVVLPDRELDQMQLFYVLRHELSHYSRRDLWSKLLILLAQSIHWFNPMVWVMARRASVDIEKACDTKVLQGSAPDARGEYGAVILSFLQNNKTNAFTGAFTLTTNFLGKKKQIIRRFELIMDTRKKKNGFLVTALTVLVAVCSVSMVGFVDVSADNKDNSPVLTLSKQDSGTPKKEEEACLTQEEWKIIYQKDIQAYQKNQEKFQQDILELYGSGNQKQEQGRMTWPLPGYYAIRSPFGFRYDGSDFHVGTDIADFPENDPEQVFGEDVVAAADGTVVLAQTKYTSGRGYGIYIILDHGDNLSTLYGHLSKMDVQEGDQVKAGQKIGEVGSTGFSTEPHLHFEIQENGIPADPAAYLLPNE